jgi:hypothetical protein
MLAEKDFYRHLTTQLVRWVPSWFEGKPKWSGFVNAYRVVAKFHYQSTRLYCVYAFDNDWGGGKPDHVFLTRYILADEKGPVCQSLAGPTQEMIDSEFLWRVNRILLPK